MLAIGLAMLAVALGIHIVSSKYENTHAFILIGALVALIGYLCGYERTRDHFYDKESLWLWYFTSVLLFIIGGSASIAAIEAAIDREDAAPLLALAFGSAFIIGGAWVLRQASTVKLRDSLTPDTYECPICDHVVGRYERSCFGCGAVVWSVVRSNPRSDVLIRRRMSSQKP